MPRNPSSSSLSCALPRLCSLSLFLSFTPSLCSQATTQLKWFAAAKKNLFSAHSRSLSHCSLPLCLLSFAHSHVPSVSLSLSRPLTHHPPLLSRCLCLNSAPFVLFPALVLKHRKCSNHAGFLSPGQKKKRREKHTRRREAGWWRERERERRRRRGVKRR